MYAVMVQKQTLQDKYQNGMLSIFEMYTHYGHACPLNIGA